MRQVAIQSALTASQLVILQIVVNDGNITPSAIAKTVALKQATITSVLDKLESKGLITRRRDSSDRRRVFIEPTNDGRKVVTNAPDLLQDRFNAQFDKLSDWEQALIISALERVANFMDAEDMDASPVLDIGDLDRSNPSTGKVPKN